MVDNEKTQTSTVNGKKTGIHFSLCVHSVRTPVALCDKEGSCFRLMTCLQCSTKSVQMLCRAKMTLLTSSVSSLSTGETTGSCYYTDTPAEQHHADEKFSPLNLIKVFFSYFLLKLHISSSDGLSSNLPQGSTARFTSLLNKIFSACFVIS